MANTALIVANFQSVFSSSNKNSAAKICDFVKDYPIDDVYWKVFQNKPDSMFVRHLGWDECIFSPESSLTPIKGIIQKNIVEQSTYSFNLETIVAWRKKYKDVILCGADTDAGIFATAFNLWDYGIRPIILADYCISSGGDEYHLPALKIMQHQFGMKSVLFGSYKVSDFLGR